MPLFRVSSPFEVSLRLKRVSINARRRSATRVIYRDRAIARQIAIVPARGCLSKGEIYFEGSKGIIPR